MGEMRDAGALGEMGRWHFVTLFWLLLSHWSLIVSGLIIDTHSNWIFDISSLWEK
jgi:hypothetical protein